MSDAVGVKTGDTKASGRCLVGAACRDGLTLISVTLDAPCDWQDHEDLLEYGYSQLQRLVLCSAGDFVYSIPVLGGSKDYITVECSEDISIVTTKNKHEICNYVKLPKFVAAPVKESDIIGKVIFTVDGNLTAEAPLIAKNAVDTKRETSFFDKLLSFFRLE